MTDHLDRSQPIDWTQVSPAWLVKCFDCDAVLSCGDRLPRVFVLTPRGDSMRMKAFDSDCVLTVDAEKHVGHDVRVVFEPGPIDVDVQFLPNLMLR